MHAPHLAMHPTSKIPPHKWWAHVDWATCMGSFARENQEFLGYQRLDSNSYVISRELSVTDIHFKH